MDDKVNNSNIDTKTEAEVELPSKQEIIFCELYIKNLCNGYLAYKEWKPKVKDTTARVEPYRLLEKPRIRAYIDKRMNEIANEHVKYNNEQLMALQIEELTRMRKGTEKTYYDALAKKDRTFVEYDNRGINDAIQNLLKMAGLDKPIKVEEKISGPDQFHKDFLEAMKQVRVEGVDDAVPDNTEENTDNGSGA